MKKVALLCVVALCLAACHCERKTTGTPCRKAACQCAAGNKQACKARQHGKHCKCAACKKAHAKKAHQAVKPAPAKSAEAKAAEHSAALSTLGTVKTQGNKVSLNYKEPIRFGHNSDVVETSSYKELDATAKVLKRYPDTKITVKGYSDALGNPDYNIDLSQRRAKAVADELVKRGVKAENVSAVGYGAADPIASNATAEGRRLNRRVELELETK